MPTRNVVLTDHHERVIDRLVRSGRYQNASEVLREGLRLVERRDELDAAKLEVLRSAVAVGFSDIEQCCYRDVDKDELDDFIAGIGQGAGERRRNQR